MRRFRVLRSMGCDPLSAAFIAVANWLRGYPGNVIRFMSVEVEIVEG